MSGVHLDLDLDLDLLASPVFWHGSRNSVSQLLRSRKGQTTTTGTPCPTVYE